MPTALRTPTDLLSTSAYVLIGAADKAVEQARQLVGRREELPDEVVQQIEEATAQLREAVDRAMGHLGGQVRSTADEAGSTLDELAARGQVIVARVRGHEDVEDAADDADAARRGWISALTSIRRTATQTTDRATQAVEQTTNATEEAARTTGQAARGAARTTGRATKAAAQTSRDAAEGAATTGRKATTAAADEAAERTAKSTRQVAAASTKTGKAAESAADAAGAVKDARDEAALSRRTKSELYELAAERDIDGRSTMNKRELVRALART